MIADLDTQLKLLDLQAADTALAQLAHRRKNLPELAAIEQRAHEVAAVHNDIVDLQTTLEDIAAEQRRMEADVDTVRARSTRDEARLQAGGLPSRELESLQHEIATLGRRQSSLEDDLLEVMERAEQAESQLRDLGAQHDTLTAELRELEACRDAALAEIDAAASTRTPERESIASGLPTDLLALYERARAQGGTGAALLRSRRCEACHIELSGSELAVLSHAAEDEVLRCDNCRAILVRTAESGL